jgi:hypothetical protein
LNFFSDPQFLAQLMSNPKARELLKDPETAMLMKLMQQQPNNSSYVIVFKNFCIHLFIYLFRLLSNPKLMKLIGLGLGLEIGDENDLNSKMETDDTASSTKKETNTSSTSKPTTTNEQNKNTRSEQNPVRKKKFLSFNSTLCFF